MVSPRLDLLCAGVTVSSVVVLVPASCVAGIPTQTVRVLVAKQWTEDQDSISDVAYAVSDDKSK